jgi:hypothetical protein
MPLLEDSTASQAFNSGPPLTTPESSGGLLDDPTASHAFSSTDDSASGYVSAGGKSTWGDVIQQGKAGLHSLAAQGASDIASHLSSPDAVSGWQKTAEQQRQAAIEATQGETPAGQQQREGSFLSHPFIVGAEQAPTMAGVAAPAIIGGITAGPIGAAVGGAAAFAEQSRGQAVDDFTQRVMETPTSTLMQNPSFKDKIDNGMSEDDAKRQYAHEQSGALALESEGLGAAIGAISPAAEFGGLGASKIIGSTITRRVLAGGVEGAVTLGTQGAGQTALSGAAEQQAGIGPGASWLDIARSGYEGAKAGAGFGVLGGLGAGGHGEGEPQGGVSANPTRSDRFYPKDAVGDNVTRNTDQQPGVSNSTAGVYKTPGSENLGTPGNVTRDQTAPSTAGGTGPAPPASPIDPTQAVALKGEPVTPGSNIQPKVVQPEPEALIKQPTVAQPAALPARIADVAPEPGNTTRPLPPPTESGEPQPPPSLASASKAPEVLQREPDATLRQQHADLLDKSNPRDAIVYPLDTQPLDIPRKGGAYGTTQLDDGRTVQFYKYGPNKLINADKVNYLAQDGKLNDLLQLGPVTKDEAVDRARQGEQGAVVTERTPDQTEVKAAAGTTDTAPAQVAALEATKGPGNTVAVERPADVLADRQAKVAQEQVVQSQVVDTPESKSLAAAPRILEDVTPEGQRARDAAVADDVRQAQTVSDQLKARELAKQAEEAPAGGQHHASIAERAKIVSDNISARKISAAHPPIEKYTSDWANQIYSHAKAMVDDAKQAGVKIPTDFREGHPYDEHMLKLREAADLVNKDSPRQEDLARFVDREGMINGGRADEAFAARRAEGTTMLGSPEHATEVVRPKGGAVDEEGHAVGREGAAQEGEAHEERYESMAGSGGEGGEVQRQAQERPATVSHVKEGEHFTAGKQSSSFKRGAGFEGMRPKVTGKIKLQAEDGEHRGTTMTTDVHGNPMEVNTSRSTTLRDAIAEHFNVKHYSPELRPAMERLRDALVRISGDTDVHYVSHDDISRVAGQGVHGLYDPSLDHILLNADNIRPDTALHEAFHAATAQAFEDHPELQELMDRLQNEMGVKGDSEEFLTRLMTEGKTQQQLKATRISPELARDIDIPKWRKATMWEGALNIIRSALGLGPRDVSAIETAMAISEKAMWSREPGMAMEASARLGKAQEGTSKPVTLAKIKFQKIGPEDLGRMSADPDEAGDKVSRAVKGFGKQLGGVAQDMLTDKGASLAKAGERLLSEPQLYDVHRDLFKDGENDPMRDRLDAMQRRGPRADELSEPGHELARQLRTLASKYGNDTMDRLERVKKLANEFSVHPDDELGKGKNAHLKLPKGKTNVDGDRDNWQARANHAEVSKLFEALPEDVQHHFIAEGEYYRDRYNLLAEQKAKNYIEGVEPPEGSTAAEVVKRMLDNKLTEEDVDHYAAKGIKNLEADDFQKRKGPYFPAERYGDFVITGEHDFKSPKGSELDHAGNALPTNVRRFDTRQEIHDFVVELDLPAKVSTRYYMEDANGKRIYAIPGTDKRITRDEAASSGYSAPKPDYRATVQNQHVSFHKTLSDANRARDALEKDGLKKLSGVMDRRGRGVDNSFTSAQTRSLIANVDRRTDLTDRQKELMKDTIRETAVVSQTGNRITKNFARSQKVQGATYRGDALTQYSQSSSRHLAAAEFAPQIDKAFKDMEDITDARRGDRETSLERSRVMNEMAARSYNARPENMYPQSAMIQRLTTIPYIMDMASASHLLTHQLNLHFMGGSVIGARHGVLSTLMEFNRIMRKAGGPWMAIKHGFGEAAAHFNDPESNGVSMYDMMRNGLTGREKSVVNELVSTGHIHRESGLDTQGIGDSRSAIGRVSRFIKDASGSMDAMGRVVTGVAAYNKELAKNGGDHAAALLYARQSIEKGLIHYGPGMRAPVFSTPRMRVISQFRLPGTNMLYLLGRNAYLAFRSTDKTTRNEAYRTLGAMMLGGWALSGSSALPTEPLKVLGILGNQLGITPSPSETSDEFRRMLASELGPSAANVIMDGPLSLMGPYAPSFAHRVASPELTFGEPSTSKPDDLMAWLSGLTFGAVGSYGVNVLRGAQAGMSGDYANMTKYLAPKLLGDTARAYELYEGGKADPGAAMMQAFGIRSQQTVRQSEGESALYNKLQSDKAAKTAALKAGTYESMARWNAANPRDRITPTELRQARLPGNKVLGQKEGPQNKATVEEYKNVYQ